MRTSLRLLVIPLLVACSGAPLPVDSKVANLACSELPLPAPVKPSSRKHTNYYETIHRKSCPVTVDVAAAQVSPIAVYKCEPVQLLTITEPALEALIDGPPPEVIETTYCAATFEQPSSAEGIVGPGIRAATAEVNLVRGLQFDGEGRCLVVLEEYVSVTLTDLPATALIPDHPFQGWNYRALETKTEAECEALIDQFR